MPKSWNGTLLIYSHGTRIDNGRGPGKAAVSQTDLNGTGTDKVSVALLHRGFALAGSSYATSGWAVQNARQSASDVRQAFLHKAGKPRRIMVWGSSMGGLITEVLAETEPWVDGAAPLCGALAGPLLTADHALYTATAVKALLAPTLQVSGWTSAADVYRQIVVERLAIQSAAHDLVHGGAAKIVFLTSVLGLPSNATQLEGANPRSAAANAAQVLAGYLSGFISLRFDLERRFGGQIARVTLAQNLALRPGAAALVAALGGDAREYSAVLARQANTIYSPAARTDLENSGDPTGTVRVPTISMHTVFDPTIPVAHESVFRARVTAHGALADLLQLFIAPTGPGAGSSYGVGHCAFSDRQMTGVMSALNDWVGSGKRPTPAELASRLGPGLDLGYAPPSWPLSTR